MVSGTNQGRAGVPGLSLTLGAPSSDFVETEIGTASLGSRMVMCDSRSFLLKHKWAVPLVLAGRLQLPYVFQATLVGLPYS